MNKRRAIYFGAIVSGAVLVGVLAARPALRALGEFLVLDERRVPADAVVVLTTGVDYYPRLVEAAALYREGHVRRVVINGNRKNESLRALERQGFVTACPWQEDFLRILALLGVPRERVLAVSAEDAYDTVSEARIVGAVLAQAGVRRVLLTTSKFHTRRASHIWRRMYPETLTVGVAAARSDPYTPDGWWREGRQVRWVFAEYGAWIYYYWKAAGDSAR